MYLMVVVLLMGVLPVVSIIAEGALSHGGADLALLIGKWFVFWSVGVRLILAGLRQIANPSFTAESIFGVRDKGALSCGNLSIGLLGACALFNAGWITPAAVAGGLFYGLAGVQHLMKGDRNSNETIAMVLDLFIFLLLAGFLSLCSSEPDEHRRRSRQPFHRLLRLRRRDYSPPDSISHARR